MGEVVKLTRTQRALLADINERRKKCSVNSRSLTALIELGFVEQITPRRVLQRFGIFAITPAGRAALPPSEDPTHG